MPLTGRAEVLCESAVAPSRSVLNSVSGYVLAPSGKEHCAPTCHGSHNFVKKNFKELQRMAAPARGSPPVDAATPLRCALNAGHGSTLAPPGAEQRTQTCRGLRPYSS